MKDFLGSELNVGDVIVAVVGHGRNAGASLEKGTVVGFTNEFVKAILPSICGNTTDPSMAIRISPKKVIKHL